MKRVIWVSLLLTLGGILLPLAFMDEVGLATADTPDTEGSVLRAPESPASAPTPSPSEDVGQAPRLHDSEITFTALIGGEKVQTTVEEYLPQALAAEMPVSFEPEALKAQAVAARTYIVYCTEHQNPKHPDADLCTDSGCCMAWLDEASLRAHWGADYETNLKIMKSAVQDTDGRILMCNAEPILASFHSSSAGMTENGSELWGNVPYLTAVSSPETENDVPDFVTTVEVSAENLKESLLLLRPETVFPEDANQWLQDPDLDESGRVRSMTIAGTRFTGQELRKLFSLRSTAFTLIYENGIFKFTVTGYGHGLGLSQYGANVLARKGFTWEEILHHYYTDTDIV